jgi:hypothetical protein
MLFDDEHLDNANTSRASAVAKAVRSEQAKAKDASKQAEDGLPVGIQFLAPARQDARLYEVAAGLEALLHAQWGGPIYAQAPELKGGA